ncbi:MAG: TonB-dependent receptor plug domain-containing protein [Bacteroidales bacterium]|nr:TonB-dependent receptor plug domain-containing protein [Bacteroidales bacterium]
MTVFSQNYTISGVIEDATTGETLIGASVYDTIHGHGTISNNYGFFSLSIPAGTVSLHFSYVGYTTLVNEIECFSDTTLNISLQPVIKLDEVTIKSTDIRRKSESTQMGLIEMPVAKLKSIPFIMGETDVLKAIQLLPGVNSGTEGTSGLFVRGGSPDQNLFLLDGVPVYNANHLFSFFSVFNSDAIRNVNVIKGGFPARYGGRLSSVVDIRMKEGNNREFHGEGSIGLISSKLSLEGPIVKEKTSFIVSARRTYLDVLYQPIVKAIDDFATARFYFYDVNAKINHQLNKNNKLYLSFYTGDDVGFYKYKEWYIDDEIKYDLQSKTGLQWGNITSVIRWNSVIHNRLFCNTTFAYTKYRFKVYQGNKKKLNPANHQSIQAICGNTFQE